jgi:HK97 family phage prohead protease
VEPEQVVSPGGDAAAQQAPAQATAASFPAFDPAYYAVPYEALPAEVKRARAAAGLPGAGMEFRTAPTEIKANVPKRQVELYIAAFGNVDAGGDIIQPGAAAKSIKRDGPDGKRRIKFFFEHQVLLGPAIAVEEHKGGIFMVGQVDDHPDLSRYLEHAKSGAVGEGSIGYSVVEKRMVKVGDLLARSLDEIKLWEGSMVAWAMNELTTIEAVKSARAAIEQKCGCGGPYYDSGNPIGAFAEVLGAQSRIEAALRFIASMAEADWAQLDTEDRATVVRLLEMFSGGEKSLREALAAKKALPSKFTTPPAPAAVPASTPAVDPAVLAGLKRVEAMLRSPLGGN